MVTECPKCIPLLDINHLCIQIRAFLPLCVFVAVYVLDYMAFKLTLQIVCVLYPQLNLPVNVNAGNKENQTKRMGREIERGEMTFPAEF